MARRQIALMDTALCAIRCQGGEINCKHASTFKNVGLTQYTPGSLMCLPVCKCHAIALCSRHLHCSGFRSNSTGLLFSPPKCQTASQYPSSGATEERHLEHHQTSQGKSAAAEARSALAHLAFDKFPCLRVPPVPPSVCPRHNCYFPRGTSGSPRLLRRQQQRRQQQQFAGGVGQRDLLRHAFVLHCRLLFASRTRLPVLDAMPPPPEPLGGG